MSTLGFNPRCVASTGDEYRETKSNNGQKRSNLFRDASFSADGTTIITQNEDHCLRSFVLPVDLLEHDQKSHTLKSLSTYQSGSNIQTFAVYPYFELQNSATTLVLSASAGVPITLRNALSFDAIHGSFPFTKSTTEEWLSARSLAFTRDGDYFVAGGHNCLAIFNCHRDGSEPVSEHKLRPGRRNARTNSWTLCRKGYASAMSVSNNGYLAVGTTEREVALFENEGLGQCASVFSLDGHAGTGVTNVKWSPDGTYLLVAERQSDVVQVYDIRNTQTLVSSLTGRVADTSQRLNVDVLPTANGYELWAGGTDGYVRTWNSPGSKEGEHHSDADLHLHHAPVSSTTWHRTGAVLATCSGAQLPSVSTDDHEIIGISDRKSESGSDANDSTPQAPDNSLKVWTL